MKELPYLKFYTGEYLTGDITICDLKTQGLFINICCYYWNRQGHYPLANAKQRFSKYEKELNELLESNILKVEGDNIVIEFLDEQLNERESLSQVRAKAGHKGGLAKAKHLISKRVAKRSNIEENKKREEKEEKKSVYVCDNPPDELNVYLYMLGYSKQKDNKLKSEVIKQIARKFHNHYSSEDNNWTYMAGGTKRTKMKDWKAKARDWVLRENK